MRFILLLLFPVTLFAGETLDDWIATAQDKNPALLAAHKKWDAAQQKVPQARAFDDPMFGVDVERTDTTRFDKHTDAEWMVSQKLPWFGKRGAKASVAQLEAEVLGFLYLELLRTTRAKVIAAYWDLWLARRAAAIANENKTILEQFEKTARTRYETGQGMQADALRAQLESTKMANEAITMEREIPVMQHTLNALLDADPDTARATDATPSIPAITQTLEQMQSQARQYCCVLMGALRAVAAKEAGIRTAKLENAPDFELRLEARQYNGRSGFQEYDTGVFINIPWLWRGKTKAKINEANADHAMAEAELQTEINQTMLDVKETYTKADAAQRLVKLYDEKLLPQTRQLLTTTRTAYETGNATFLELLEAQKAARDAQLDHDRALADLGKARAKLDSIIAPWGEREFATGLVKKDQK